MNSVRYCSECPLFQLSIPAIPREVSEENLIESQEYRTVDGRTDPIWLIGGRIKIQQLDPTIDSTEYWEKKQSELKTTLLTAAAVGAIFVALAAVFTAPTTAIVVGVATMTFLLIPFFQYIEAGSEVRLWKKQQELAEELGNLPERIANARTNIFNFKRRQLRRDLIDKAYAQCVITSSERGSLLVHHHNQPQTSLKVDRNLKTLNSLLNALGAPKDNAI